MHIISSREVCLNSGPSLCALIMEHFIFSSRKFESVESPYEDSIEFSPFGTSFFFRLIRGLLEGVTLGNHNSAFFFGR